MNKSAAADIVIVGGGIAGLWLLTRLRQSGWSAILFESDTLGGGQTHKAQGIIHGGFKYALQGVLTSEARALAAMPKRWQQCLAGQGEIDLSAVPILSSKHYLWAPRKLTAKFAGLLAGMAFTSPVVPLPKAHYPTIFQHPAFRGEVFSVEETVIDVQRLIRELVSINQGCLFKIDPLADDSFEYDEQGRVTSMIVKRREQAMRVLAQQFIFTAGAGNEGIIKRVPMMPIRMQRRPLHMVIAKLPFDYPLYAHCLGLGARPRLTITTHRLADGCPVWYLGGQLAEEGVGKSSDEQIQATRRELETLFPWLDFSAVEFATFMIDRAEPQQKGGLKPETVFVKGIQNRIVAWPTKLTLAPQLADDIMQLIHRARLSPPYLDPQGLDPEQFVPRGCFDSQGFDLQALQDWPVPTVARPIWETLFCKSTA